MEVLISRKVVYRVPPIPDDDLTTVRVAYYLVANKKLRDRVISELAKAIMEVRRDMLAEFPVLTQIGVPSTDKDALISIHPGAAAYFEGTEQSFLDTYSNALYLIPMAFGAIASLVAAMWKFVEGENKETETPLDRLYSLARLIRDARGEADVNLVEEKIDNILAQELKPYSKGGIDAGNAAALSLAAHRLEHLITHRRSTFALSAVELKSAKTAQ